MGPDWMIEEAAEFAGVSEGEIRNMVDRSERIVGQDFREMAGGSLDDLSDRELGQFVYAFYVGGALQAFETLGVVDGPA